MIFILIITDQSRGQDRTDAVPDKTMFPRLLPPHQTPGTPGPPVQVVLAPGGRQDQLGQQAGQTSPAFHRAGRSLRLSAGDVQRRPRSETLRPEGRGEEELEGGGGQI